MLADRWPRVRCTRSRILLEDSQKAFQPSVGATWHLDRRFPKINGRIILLIWEGVTAESKFYFLIEKQRPIASQVVGPTKSDIFIDLPPLFELNRLTLTKKSTLATIKIRSQISRQRKRDLKICLIFDWSNMLKINIVKTQDQFRIKIQFPSFLKCRDMNSTHRRSNKWLAMLNPPGTKEKLQHSKNY